MRIGNQRGWRAMAIALLASSALMDGAVWAQDPGQSSANNATAASQSQSGGDIVVTANKREQKLNDVGLAVAVVQGDTFKTRQINNLNDIAKAIPSLTYTNSANNTPVYTLRGIGFYETSLGAYPAVSVYIDQIALPFPVLSKHSAYDLERVEVLKGPQGTLFGENSTGGAINFIAAKPTTSFHAGAQVSYGRFNEMNVEGYISGPITDTLSARVAGRLEREDAWQISNSRPGDRNGKVRNYMGRAIVDWKPLDGLRFEGNINGWRDKSDPQAPQFIGLQPSDPVLSPELESAQFSPHTARAADWTAGLPFADNSFIQGALRGDLDISDNITLTSLTAYTHYRQRQGEDVDGLPFAEIDLPLDLGRISSFSQELRLGNGGHARFRWVLGGNYERDHVSQKVDNEYGGSSSTATLGAIGYPIYSSVYSADQQFRNWAVFANGEYDVGQITLKGGVRYTNSRDHGTSCNADDTGDPQNAGAFFYDVLLGGALGSYPTGTCFVINDQSTTINGVTPGNPGEYGSVLHEDNVSWRAGVDWKPRSGLLLYTNVAKGYKAGSFPTVTGSVFTSYLPVHQESVQSYEAGFKATLLEHTLQLNGALFWYDYKNKQIRAKVDAEPFGILDVLQNIPKTRIRGFEIEADIRPVRRLTINVAFTYIDAEIQKFIGINGVGLAGNFAGTPVPFTPKYQVSIDPDYSFPISDRLSGFVGASLNFRSATISVIGGETNPPDATPAGPPLSGIKAYALLDLRAGIEVDGGKYRVSVYGKNVLNEYYWNNVFNTTDTIGRFTGQPATYGISLAAKF